MVDSVDVSAREAEVLALVAEHLSNAEIGARLYISVRTVESHVSSLLRKLGAPDRRSLARRTVESERSQRSVPLLPVPLTSFVGRTVDRLELHDLITAHRQVTALGPGGVGKTRLALAVAADATNRFDDGVWFVDLVPVSDPGLVAGAVAGAVGIGEQPGRGMGASVIAALADRRALLVLDNCEQVRDGVASFLERLLAACPGVTVLATSRTRLMVPFERVYPVAPLSLTGDGESDAVALFMDRAVAGGPPPDRGQREAVAEICRRLDGMALAIELAAARYPMLGIDGITAALSDPLRMLAGGSRADDRHRSVRAALDWSHALMEPADRALLRMVSVFVAPFSVGAAADVTGSDRGVVADGLARLAEHSLLVVTASVAGTEYQALEIIRQYGTEQLTAAGELDKARSRHLGWCLSTATRLARRTPRVPGRILRESGRIPPADVPAGQPPQVTDPIPPPDGPPTPQPQATNPSSQPRQASRTDPSGRGGQTSGADPSGRGRPVLGTDPSGRDEQESEADPSDQPRQISEADSSGRGGHTPEASMSGRGGHVPGAGPSGRGGPVLGTD
ncbi:MAG: ATP-binding protein, partial [Stackebrandtia sp.]